MSQKKDIKWNQKNSINPKKGRKRRKWDKEQMEQAGDKTTDLIKPNNINKHIKCKWSK